MATLKITVTLSFLLLERVITLNCVSSNNLTGQTTGKLTSNTTYKIQCTGYQSSGYAKKQTQTTVTVAKPVSNFTLTNSSGSVACRHYCGRVVGQFQQRHPDFKRRNYRQCKSFRQHPGHFRRQSSIRHFGR